MKTLKCPSCGANLKVEEDQSICTCEYCGTFFDNPAYKPKVEFEKIADQPKSSPPENNTQNNNSPFTANDDTHSNYCPNCGSTDIGKMTVQESNGERGCLFWILILCFLPWSLFLFLIPNFGSKTTTTKKNHCNKCQHTWE